MGNRDEEDEAFDTLERLRFIQVLCKLGGRYLYNNHHSVLFSDFGSLEFGL